MAYIEENMKKRRMGEVDEADSGAPKDAVGTSGQNDTKRKAVEEGNVTNSASMLTAIPEVDLGMEYAFSSLDAVDDE